MATLSNTGTALHNRRAQREADARARAADGAPDDRGVDEVLGPLVQNDVQDDAPAVATCSPFQAMHPARGVATAAAVECDAAADAGATVAALDQVSPLPSPNPDAEA
jgi:hypothetical protein